MLLGHVQRPCWPSPPDGSFAKIPPFATVNEERERSRRVVRRRRALVLPGELDGWLRVVRSRRLEPTPRGSSCALAREGEKSRQKSSPKPSSSCLPPHAEGERRAGGVGTGARRGGVEPLRGEQAAPAPGKSGASRAPAPGRGRADPWRAGGTGIGAGRIQTRQAHRG